jgi:hypothetical protein
MAHLAMSPATTTPGHNTGSEAHPDGNKPMSSHVELLRVGRPEATRLELSRRLLLG